MQRVAFLIPIVSSVVTTVGALLTGMNPLVWFGLGLFPGLGGGIAAWFAFDQLAEAREPAIRPISFRVLPDVVLASVYSGLATAAGPTSCEGEGRPLPELRSSPAVPAGGAEVARPPA